MIWQFLLLILVLLLIIPIPIKLKITFNILRLKGEVEGKIFWFKIKLKFRLRGQYVYITTKKGTKREKITNNNYNLAFVIEIFKQIYYRTHLTQLNFITDIGYYNNALITALSSSIVDILAKCISAKILHNKKSAHIYINNEPKYNEDRCKAHVEIRCFISLFDIIYSFVNTVFNLKGDKYEKQPKSTIEQNQIFD